MIIFEQAIKSLVSQQKMGETDRKTKTKNQRNRGVLGVSASSPARTWCYIVNLRSDRQRKTTTTFHRCPRSHKTKGKLNYLFSLPHNPNQSCIFFFFRCNFSKCQRKRVHLIRAYNPLLVTVYYDGHQHIHSLLNQTEFSRNFNYFALLETV